MKRTLRYAIMLALCVLPLAGAGAAYGAPGRAPAASPRERFAEEYRLLASPSWRHDFPNLGSRFVVIGRSTGKYGTPGTYNCIAHTVGVHNQWVWPGDQVGDFDRLYGQYGYRRVRGLDYRVHPQLDKIVLYGKHQNGRVVCTHGSRQQRNGTWTSKLGAGPLIRHPGPGSVNGPSYGQPIAVYVRARR
jgi:hypothetical protein